MTIVLKAGGSVLAVLLAGSLGAARLAGASAPPSGASVDVASVGAVSLARPAVPGKAGVFYFVLTDRFANGRTDNDTGGYLGGRNDHGFDPTAISHYHGGDLAGLTQRLDYLKGLGVTAIWLTPPFRNKPVQSGTAAYHGYWILDFLAVDPHLGTEEEFRGFVAAAQARGIRVFMDVILNHTADVIMPEGGDIAYRDRAGWPYRDAQGRPFDETRFIDNGVGAPPAFPELSAERSFAHRPTLPVGEERAKNPAWLNDVRLYHNRGNTDFTGEKSLHGDFVGLDDLFTEHPVVVRGMIDIYRHWIERHGVDGFRIDTAKHTNIELWQAFGPAMREAARRAGKPGFFSFGEVATGDTDATLLSEFSTLGTLDASLDFPLAIAVRDFVGRAGPAAGLASVFHEDDRYTDHDSTARALPTFLGNHDQGRFAWFLRQLDPAADDARLLKLSKLGHALLFLVRGQPVVYYGDEQGMIGRYGHDMQARESMFASQAPDFRTAPLLGTSRTGADDKFDPEHPLYRHLAELARLRAEHPALAEGAMIVRPTPDDAVFAFSRIERDEQIEYVIALGNQREGDKTVAVPTSQREGAVLRLVYQLGGVGRTETTAAETRAGADGTLRVQVPPLGVVVWRAERPLSRPVVAPTLRLVRPLGVAELVFGAREIDGQRLTERQEIRADVTGGDGVAEVTFVARRSSRPDTWEYLGTDDAPPYRVFWRPPADWAAGETITFAATVDSLRGDRAVAELPPVRAARPLAATGIAGAHVPRFTERPPAEVRTAAGTEVVLRVRAEGVPEPTYQWYRNGVPLLDQQGPALSLRLTPADAGARLVAVARNLAGAAVSAETLLKIEPEPAR